MGHSCRNKCSNKEASLVINMNINDFFQIQQSPGDDNSYTIYFKNKTNKDIEVKIVELTDNEDPNYSIKWYTFTPNNLSGMSVASPQGSMFADREWYILIDGKEYLMLHSVYDEKTGTFTTFDTPEIVLEESSHVSLDQIVELLNAGIAICKKNAGGSSIEFATEEDVNAAIEQIVWSRNE